LDSIEVGRWNGKFWLLSKQVKALGEICHALGVEPEIFQSAAPANSGAYPGKLGDGCCGAPCGSMCVVL